MNAEPQGGTGNYPLILASASPRRAELLAQMGLSFRIVQSDVPEISHDQLTAREVAQVNAYRKARTVAKRHVDALVLGADTVVCAGQVLFGKPSDQAEALRMLEQLQGRTHQVITAVCLLYLREHRQRLFAETTDVTFKALGSSEIESYIARTNPLDKAGAYAIQEHGEMLIERVDGSHSNVIGLPVERLKEALEEFTVG